MMDIKASAIVTDIEGTTTPLTFVKDVLFPYARKNIADFIFQHANENHVREQLDDVRRLQNAPDLSLEDIEKLLIDWIDTDKKIAPLKALQGMIWEEGYRNGEFVSQVYPDAIAQLKKWHQKNIPLYVYSSGSIMAQKLLFGYTQAGDLNGIFSGYFDTTLGGKLIAESYNALSRQIKKPPADILFLSDNEGELNAAQNVGFQVIQIFRDGMIAETKYPAAVDFTFINVSRIA